MSLSPMTFHAPYASQYHGRSAPVAPPPAVPPSPPGGAGDTARSPSAPRWRVEVESLTQLLPSETETSAQLRVHQPRDHIRQAERQFVVDVVPDQRVASCGVRRTDVDDARDFRGPRTITSSNLSPTSYAVCSATQVGPTFPRVPGTSRRRSDASPAASPRLVRRPRGSARRRQSGEGSRTFVPREDFLARMRVRAVVGEGRHGSVRREPGVDRGFDVDIPGCDLDPSPPPPASLGIGASTGREHHRLALGPVPEHAGVRDLKAAHSAGTGRRGEHPARSRATSTAWASTERSVSFCRVSGEGPLDVSQRHARASTPVIGKPASVGKSRNLTMIRACAEWRVSTS